MALTDKNKLGKDRNSDQKRYTIFHALFEALREKDNEHTKR